MIIICARRTSVHNTFIYIHHNAYFMYLYVCIYITHLRDLTPADEVRLEYNIIYVSWRVCCVFVYRFEYTLYGYYTRSRVFYCLPSLIDVLNAYIHSVSVYTQCSRMFDIPRDVV